MNGNFENIRLKIVSLRKHESEHVRSLEAALVADIHGQKIGGEPWVADLEQWVVDLRLKTLENEVNSPSYEMKYCAPQIKPAEDPDKFTELNESVISSFKRHIRTNQSLSGSAQGGLSPKLEIIFVCNCPPQGKHLDDCYATWFEKALEGGLE
ncbi:MAG: hypothetical protein ACFFGZ_10280 [Candidatus Thorarchaeota archaeon]